MTTWTLRTTSGGRRVHADLTGLSIDAAREVARAHAALGYRVTLVEELPPRPSKQRRYQLRHRTLGLCQKCPLPAVDGWHCPTHQSSNRKRNRERMRATTGSAPWRPGGPGRPPLDSKGGSETC